MAIASNKAAKGRIVQNGGCTASSVIGAGADASVSTAGFSWPAPPCPPPSAAICAVACWGHCRASAAA